MHQDTYDKLRKWNCKGVLCISGPHGIGKTFTIQAYCAEKNKKCIDLIAERERLDVKWDAIPQSKNSIGVIDAPLLTPGDGGIASLKRFLKSSKQPIIIVLDSSMLKTYSDIVKTYKV